MTRGGKREGAGGKKPRLPEHLKAKTKSFRLYDWEVEKVKGFIKELRVGKAHLN